MFEINVFIFIFIYSYTLEKGEGSYRVAGRRCRVSLGARCRGRGGGGPTRLCPGERTNGLVSLPRGSSAGPSSTWVINICDRGDSWPRSGLTNPETITPRNGSQRQTPRHYLWAQQPRRWHSIWYRVILSYFQGKSSLAVKPSSDVSVNNANGCAPIADRPPALRSRSSPLLRQRLFQSQIRMAPLKSEITAMFPPRPRANVFKFASPEEQQSNKLFKE